MNAEQILNRCICGFHQYILDEPVRLSYASDQLCEMTGYTREELLADGKDGYRALVHPSDVGIYAEFIARLKEREQTLTAQYRLVKKNGEVIFVQDQATSGTEDGRKVCYSSLADVGGIKNENDNLQYLSETMPCGFLKYTCEKQPKITYINRQMMDILRIPKQSGAEVDYLDLYRENVFQMIPMEERRRFSLYLNRVYSLGIPLVGEISLLRCDGTRAYIIGWAMKTVNDRGEEEFQSVCIDITERQREKRDRERKQYLKALTDVYDKIFEYNLSTGTVVCLYSDNSPMFKWTENIPMQMDEATEKWITDVVVEEDAPRVRTFFDDFCHKRLRGDGGLPQITYRARSASGEIKFYRGVLIKTEESVSMYCLKCLGSEDIESIREENSLLKENLQNIVTHFTEGIAAFVITGDLVTPLYAGDNVCGFFGMTPEEWYPLMQKKTPLREFVARSDIEYEDFQNLLRDGEGEFIYYDFKTETGRRVKAICSIKSSEDDAPKYVMLYKEKEGESAEPKQNAKSEVVIRTFGYFDVFVDGKAIAFRNKKSKELFALLIDRRGGYVTSEEAIGVLWEDEAASAVTLARYRKVAMRLKNILEEYGISDIIETVDGKRRVVMEKVRCDLYDYLSGKEEYAQLFKGSYLANYSWAEVTLAELSRSL